MQAVILAGGLGTRMRPYTENSPKCLLPVRGRPFIDYQMELLRAGGIGEVVICLGNLGEMVEAHLRDIANLGMSVRYSWDGAVPLGTAGALKQAEPLLEERFILTWGDSYVRVDHAAMFAAHRARPEGVIGTMGVFCNRGAYDASNVEIDGDKVARYEKGSADRQFTHIDAGVSILERKALAEIPPKKNLSLDQYFSSWASRGDLGAFPIDERFYEVGSWAGLADFEAFLSTQGGR
jgi:MurNAc alpha-1-phosphate uridylyltransferase